MSVDEISPIRIALAVITLLPIASPAVCADQTWKPEWSWTYDGTIGPYRVRFELLEARGSVTGYYFYASQLKDIRLFGTIADGRRIELQGLATGGEPEAEISGEFLDKDPQGRLKGNLTCDIIIGTWHNTDGSSKLPVSLRTIASIPNPHGHGYEVAGASDDERINRAAERFRQAVTEWRSGYGHFHDSIPDHRLPGPQTGEGRRSRTDDYELRGIPDGEPRHSEKAF